MKTPKLKYIEWLDSKGVSSDWEFIEGLKPMLPCNCKSIGFLIDDQKEYKTIAQTISDEQYLGRMTIPTCSIIRIKNIHLNTKKVKRR